MKSLENLKIGVVGLGYVGLPLAVAFGLSRRVVGFDIDKQRVEELKTGIDVTREISSEQLRSAKLLEFSSEPSSLKDVNTFIISVPTPVDRNRIPDLSPIIDATKLVARYVNRGDIIIYESTVYPGLTEDVCGVLINKITGLEIGYNDQDKDVFFLGYSPERINPGASDKKLQDIVKITSGSSPRSAMLIDELYQSIVDAGTHLSPDIKTAEAAKIVENIQRDVNIALMNELSQVFYRMGLDTKHVLDASKTKWNFLPFEPGLVGGHCISVDPYYLIYKAAEMGLHPDTIMAARRVNESVPQFVATSFVKLLVKKKIQVSGAKVLILGVTFKENCVDMRNSKTLDLIDKLSDFGVEVEVCDPLVVNEDSQLLSASLPTVCSPEVNSYDGIILAVPHQEFVSMGSAKIKKWMKKKSVFFDLKSVFEKHESDGRL
jgi:UDP-N-acetyl-D-galactosamine dehydrogenase